jgi:transcription initiation factor TFIID subunit 5
MSGNGASSSNSAPTNNAVIGEGSSSSNAAPSDQNQIVLQFLERRGYHRAAAALQAEIASPSTTSNQQPASLPAATAKALTADEFANRNAPAASNSKAKEDSLQKWRQVNDPSIYETGYKSLRAFVEGSLEMHRVELQSLLWPVFVHVYLDLVAAGDGFRLAADALMARFVSWSSLSRDELIHSRRYGGEYDYEQHGLIQHLKALQLPEHLQESGDVRRWRTEKYMLTLSERGWGLLQSWLIGGNLSFHDPAAKSGSVNDKGRDKVLSIINERLEIKIGKSSSLISGS